MTNLSEEPSDQVTEYNGLIGLVVVGGRRNGREVPEVCLPFVQVAICGLGVDQQNPRGALDKPATIEYSDTAVSHRLDCCGQFWDGWFQLLNLDSSLDLLAICRRQEGQTVFIYRLVVERPYQGVPLAILGRRYWSLGLEDRVDTAHCSRYGQLADRAERSRGFCTYLGELPRSQSRREGDSSHRAVPAGRRRCQPLW